MAFRIVILCSYSSHVLLRIITCQLPERKWPDFGRFPSIVKSTQVLLSVMPLAWAAWGLLTCLLHRSWVQRLVSYLKLLLVDFIERSRLCNITLPTEWNSITWHCRTHRKFHSICYDSDKHGDYRRLPSLQKNCQKTATSINATNASTGSMGMHAVCGRIISQDLKGEIVKGTSSIGEWISTVSHKEVSCCDFISDLKQTQ